MPECYFGSLPEPLHQHALSGESAWKLNRGWWCWVPGLLHYERPSQNEWLLPRYGLWKAAWASWLPGQPVPKCLSRRRECYPEGSKKMAFFNRMSMGGLNSTGSSQRPTDSGQVKQDKTFSRGNISKKAVEGLLHDLPNLQQSAGTQSRYCSLVSHPSFALLEPAVCVRYWIALHQLGFGVLVCAALSALSVVSSRYYAVFREPNKPSGAFRKRDTYSFFIFVVTRIWIFNCLFCDLLAGCLFCNWHLCFHHSCLVACQYCDGHCIGKVFSVLKNLLQKSGCSQ